MPLLASEEDSKCLRLAKQCAKSPENVHIVYSPETSRLFVDEGKDLILVENHSMDKLLNVILKQDSLDHSALGKFLTACYISAAKQSDNAYYLRASGRLLGGGPLMSISVIQGVVAAAPWINIGITTAHLAANVAISAGSGGTLAPALLASVPLQATQIIVESAFFTSTAATVLGGIALFLPGP